MRRVVHKQSGGMSMVFPDVCKTPIPGSPVPIPYPNIGQASDTSSSGDEAGTAGSAMNSCNRRECEFMMYSFDVKFEGKNVCRRGDPLRHNKKNMMG
ncbi:DUF4150 domain-containing protein [Sorangium sp. So ce764]|uniref:DUF4150 domain-containing protein n=1 Tax=unclassified Sorangium TaxID=2621164 RepID=UPI003F6332E0